MVRFRSVLFFLCINLYAFGFINSPDEDHSEDPHYVWFDGKDVVVHEDGIYIDSNKGMAKINVVEYDRLNDRYKVLCRCLFLNYTDPLDSISFPYEDENN